MAKESFSIPKKESDRRAQEQKDEYLESKDLLGNKYSHELVPRSLLKTDDIDDFTWKAIYGWYEKAIARRDREPLEEERFIAHFSGMSLDPTYAFGDTQDGFLLGYLKYGVFVPTHFAPKTMRGGYELVNNLGDSHDTPALLAVTEDLAETLEKIKSWNQIDLSFLSTFRDDIVKKKIFFNSHPDTQNLIMGLVAEYLDSNENKF